MDTGSVKKIKEEIGLEVELLNQACLELVSLKLNNSKRKMPG
jgi:hypothetical protein